MKSTSRFLALSLLVLFAMGGAYAQKAPEAPTGPVELTMVDSFLDNLGEPDVVALNAKIKEFTQKHPNIKITRDRSSADVIDTKVPTLAAANNLPDMFACRSAWAPNFADAGSVMSVEQLMKDDKAFLDGFIPGMLDDFQYKGSHYGIAWRSMPVYVMYYNMDMLKKAGINKVPADFNEFLAAVKAVKATGAIPLVMGDKGKWQTRLLFSALNVRTAGVDYLERLHAGTLKFTDPAFAKSLGVMEQLAKAGAFNKDFTSIEFMQSRALYYNKKAAMYGELAAFAQVENEQWPEDLKKCTEMTFFPKLPGEDLSKGVPVPVAADWGMAFNSKLSGDKLKAAQVFAVEVLGDDYNRLLAEVGGIAVRKFKGGDFSKVSEAVKRYNEQLGPVLIAGGHIDGRMPGAVLDAASANLQDLLLGRTTVAKVQKSLQAAFEKASKK
jgi:raffinose/stachyose/melibiose transport system substrate-binding protein